MKGGDRYAVEAPAYVTLRTFYSATSTRKRRLTNQSTRFSLNDSLY